jgi:hypothetical protein
VTVRISDHALVRFLERAGGLDVELLRSTLAASLDRAVKAAEAVGVADYDVHIEDSSYHIRSGTLVTIRPRNGQRAFKPGLPVRRGRAGGGAA